LEGVLTQPVVIQSFNDEFDLPNATPQLPAPPGEVLIRNFREPLSAEPGAKYRIMALNGLVM
jgi:hypothetical protein